MYTYRAEEDSQPCQVAAVQANSNSHRVFDLQNGLSLPAPVPATSFVLLLQALRFFQLHHKITIPLPYTHIHTTPQSQMAPGRRRIPTPGKDLIIPLALGLTAAIATVGLYLWPDTDSSYSSGSSGDEREKDRGRHRKLKTRRQLLEHDRITEEDTDDLEEDRRRDEKLKLKGKQPNTMMAGALQLGGTAVATVATVVEAVVGKKESEPDPIKLLKEEAATNTQQYVPLPAKKRTVAVVVAERKALEGHDSDSDFEETGLPSVRLP